MLHVNCISIFLKKDLWFYHLFFYLHRNPLNGMILSFLGGWFFYSKNFYCWTFNLIILLDLFWNYHSMAWASGAWRSERIPKATPSPACCPAPSTQHMVHMISTGQMSESYWARMAWESPQHRTEPFAGLGELLAWDPNPVLCLLLCDRVCLPFYPHLNFLQDHAGYTRLFFNYGPLDAICLFVKLNIIVNYLREAFWKKTEDPLVEITLILECKDFGSTPCLPLSFAMLGVSPNLPDFRVLL